MGAPGKQGLTEQDIRSQFISPAITGAGWDQRLQIREEVSLTAGRVIVRGKLHTRGKQKRADYVLFHKPDIPLAVVEAKDKSHSLGAGMQQALEYAEMLGLPFAFSSNGEGFLFHDATASDQVERVLGLDEFPSPEELWAKFVRPREADLLWPTQHRTDSTRRWVHGRPVAAPRRCLDHLERQRKNTVVGRVAVGRGEGRPGGESC